MKLLQILNELVNHPFSNKKNITIKNGLDDYINITCEEAKTKEEKITGVLGLNDMCKNCGVFFDGVSPTHYHMQGVKIPLDMIFCDDEGNIIDIVTAQPDGDNVYPPKNAKFNIEVNGGFCEDNNISIGNKIYKS
jgi:uncharacterized membrane protein (UPF0127 family)